MPFTDDEKLRWHEQKRASERRPELHHASVPVAICIHCSNPFAFDRGMITEEVAICDVCNGD